VEADVYGIVCWLGRSWFLECEAGELDLYTWQPLILLERMFTIRGQRSPSAISTTHSGPRWWKDIWTLLYLLAILTKSRTGGWYLEIAIDELETTRSVQLSGRATMMDRHRTR